MTSDFKYSKTLFNVIFQGNTEIWSHKTGGC